MLLITAGCGIYALTLECLQPANGFKCTWPWCTGDLVMLGCNVSSPAIIWQIKNEMCGEFTITFISSDGVNTNCGSMCKCGFNATIVNKVNGSKTDSKLWFTFSKELNGTEIKCTRADVSSDYTVNISTLS